MKTEMAHKRRIPRLKVRRLFLVDVDLLQTNTIIHTVRVMIILLAFLCMFEKNHWYSTIIIIYRKMFLNCPKPTNIYIFVKALLLTHEFIFAKIALQNFSKMRNPRTVQRFAQKMTPQQTPLTKEAKEATSQSQSSPSSSPPRPIASSSISTLYNQLNGQLNAEIEAIESSKHPKNQDLIPTRNLRPIDQSSGIMSSYYFGSSSTPPSGSKEGKTKISVSIIGDAFVDLFCFLNDGNIGADGGKLPVLGGDVRIHQPGERERERDFFFVDRVQKPRIAFYLHDHHTLHCSHSIVLRSALHIFTVTHHFLLSTLLQYMHH